MVQPKVAAKCLRFSSGILIGTNIDVEKFNFNPVESTKVFRRAFDTNNFLAQPSIMISVSSAY